VVALAGALQVVGAIKAGMGLAAGASGAGRQDQWHGRVRDAHPLDYIEGRH
jgi:hypothetical protein